MKNLFDTDGNHIANEQNGQLYDRNGKNIGRLLSSHGFFVDLKGFYLGEIVQNNRLLHKLNNGYENTPFGSHGSYGNMGNMGSPGRISGIGQVYGYQNIDKTKLQ